MPKALVNGIQLDYEVFGPEGGEPLLLVMGLAMQRVAWPASLLDALLARGFRCITVDNRDVGHSTRYDDIRAPALPTSIAARLFGLRPRLPYGLADLADDDMALLAHLGIERAHVAGISMGGMIAQRVAAQAPRRVDKLVLMSTHVGGLRVFWPHPRAVQVLFPEPGTPAAQIVRARMAGIAAPGFADKNPHTVDAIVASALGAPTPLRTYRYQLQAVLRDDRYPVLRHIQAETLVVHGDADPLVPFENGKLLARKIPHAHLAVLHGCGHLPMWEQPEQLCRAVTQFLDGGPVSFERPPFT